LIDERASFGSIASIAFSPNGGGFVIGGSSGTLFLYDFELRKLLHETRLAHEGRVNSVAYSRDGDYIVSGGQDSTLRLWDASNGWALGQPIRGHHDAVESVAFSSDGQSIVSGASNGEVFVWSLATVPGNFLQVACHYLPHINGLPVPFTDDLASEIGIEGLTLPDDCDSYEPPLPSELRQ
jgi:WD40 repeat protein